ncbi:sugar transferase [Clostridium fallax]|uniref:Sugar transferase involved in LPS biosynthesis (Colanic, teichoic acid) n=1 Tax=Clostridium fallax TaxID=1533 RepID=A0A1M4WQW0_9CLOT|nr:sugar transferase [Clostridium fallax]SHE83616.1 Sugar transferase involved in LPS biosynthesis (colanic, teichoic acid) [Clostridium fallax]SQB06281.1 undecaprenyl phosphate galactosephosphotransferase [Clostridium fallax]
MKLLNEEQIQKESKKNVAEESFIYKRRVYCFIKRLLDIICSLVGLIVLIPIFLIIAIAIKLDSKGPIFFKQKRLGLRGKNINIYKFRTMVINAEEMINNFSEEQKKEYEENFKLKNDPRITKIGKFLRNTSLDELPQLLNILKGDINIVGPRPIVNDELHLYGSYAKKFLSIKPGITGYWQTNGRSSTSYEDRVKMDMYYIDNRNLLLDIKIIFKTVGVLFGDKNAM